uniref:Rx N-terminal domain-containing protein n=1 Tax=Leersia perrieri TaxID=77586 RepID=A0A0D9XU29_9ORYZ
MADLALGLAKSAVEGTVSKVVSAIKEEADLKERVQHDLVFITDEFQMMRSFLNGVGREQVVNNTVVRTWVSQVRDLAYDVEDCIEFLVHLDSKPAWWHRLFPSFMAPVLSSVLSTVPLPLDEAVADLKQLKARVEDVSQRNMRYNLIAADSGKPRQPAPAAANYGGAAAFDLLVEAKEIARKEIARGDLTQLITKNLKEDSELRVISLWGTDGDLGIVSTIREAYDSRKACKKFGCRGWVKMVHPFNLHALLESLLGQFKTNSGQEGGITTVQGGGGVLLVNEFKRQVSDKRYLIVLEDLSTMVEWDAIRTHLPDMSCGSRIIISTQNFEIASVCAAQPFLIWELKRLSANHSVCVLFNEGVVASKQDADQSEVMHDVGRTREMIAFSNILFRRGHKVVSVWGIWGVGKSNFVRQWQTLEKHADFERFGWVNVPRPFNLRDFSRSLLYDLCRPEFRAEHHNAFLGMSRIRDPVDGCRKLIHDHRCLVVIDGLRSTDEWDLIKANLANGHFSSSIVVTTNEANVARYCAMPSKAVLKLNCIEADQALDLFKQY